jgi:hypothetical protein
MGSEERGACVLDGSLDAPLFASPRRRHRARLEAVVSGEVEELGMEADHVALALEHDAAQIVVVLLPGALCARACSASDAIVADALIRSFRAT